MTKRRVAAVAVFALAIAACGGRIGVVADTVDAGEPTPAGPPIPPGPAVPPIPPGPAVPPIPPGPAPQPDGGQKLHDAGPGADAANDASIDVDPCRNVMCGFSNGSGACVDGKCTLLTCNPGFADCDGNEIDGCEPLQTLHVDADGDGFGSATQTKQACTAAGLVANGTDCFDGNAKAHPGQTAFFSVDRGDGSFDYDCDGAASLADPDPVGEFCVCSNGACSGAEGWIDPVPACGQSASWATYGGQSCTPSPVSRVQTCR